MTEDSATAAGTTANSSALDALDALATIELPRINNNNNNTAKLHVSRNGADDMNESFSLLGMHRRKHTLRFLFRSASLVALIGGYAVYNSLSGSPLLPLTSRAGLRSSGGNGSSPNLNSNLNSNLNFNEGRTRPEELSGASSFSNFKISNSSNNDRQLQDNADGTGDVTDAATNDAAETSPKEEEVVCTTGDQAEPTWTVAFYALGTLYMFLALAIVCDEFFVPALEEISCEHHLNLSMDVAGATLMAAGGSAPELFTSFVGTFQQSDIGIGTIVGSAVFNVLFVIGTCSMLSKEVLTLTWWPLFRDSAYYATGLIVLSVLAGVVSAQEIYWWEALILLAMYVGYVVLMAYNRKLYTFLTGKTLVLAGEQDNDNDNASTTQNNSDTLVDAASNGNGNGNENGNATSNANGQPTTVEKSPSGTDFRWPGTFRAGVLKLLLHPANWADRGGIGIVAKMQGDVDHVFRQIDINGDGSIDKEELAKLFDLLGHHLLEPELLEVFTMLDLDSSGEISFEEFSKWYLKSEERILSKVKHIFEKFDADKSGTIDREELRSLLKSVEPRATEEDVDEALKAMYKTGSAEEITFEEFSDWYVHSIIYTRQQKEMEKAIEEEAHGVCEALKPPFGEGCFSWFRYILVLPLVTCLTLTVPDVRRPGFGKWCYVSFILSICWIGIFSYFMVDWAEVLGNTIGIPSVVMGYTFLAAGTSVPDLLSSVIVARMGEGDMAVSSSIGSNIFDILVGLPLPWLIFTLWPSTPDVVTISANGIWISIFILIGMLVAIIIIIHCQGWKMTRALGGMMFVLYFCFIAQAITVEYYRDPCFG